MLLFGLLLRLLFLKIFALVAADLFVTATWDFVIALSVRTLCNFGLIFQEFGKIWRRRIKISLLTGSWLARISFEFAYLSGQNLNNEAFTKFSLSNYYFCYFKRWMSWLWSSNYLRRAYDSLKRRSETLLISVYSITIASNYVD